jgi:hypothetical protein
MTERVASRSKERHFLHFAPFGAGSAIVLYSFMEESIVDPLHERIGER